MEETLRRNEEHFRLLVESTLDHAVFMLSPEGLVESWNRGAQRLKGYRTHEIVGVHFKVFFPAEENEKHTTERLRDEAALSGHAAYEGWLVRKNGTRFWGAVTLSAVEDESGRLRGFSGGSFNKRRSLSAEALPRPFSRSPTAARAASRRHRAAPRAPLPPGGPSC